MVAELCVRVLERLEHLRLLSWNQLSSLTELETTITTVGGRHATISTFRSVSNGRVFVVVQGFVTSFRWPTFIGTSGVGHIVAEGFLVAEDGSIVNAPDELLWEYR